MEYREDLAEVLLSGLSDGERHHVVDVIHQVEDEQLRSKRATGVDVNPGGEGEPGEFEEV